MLRPGLLVLSLLAAAQARWGAWKGTRRVDDRDRQRGDVPGWVLVTIMTAAVVVVLIPFVGPVIAHAFEHAVNSVSNTPSSTQ
jgi:type VI protein secretion system component VasF